MSGGALPSKPYHVPVLLDQVLNALAPHSGGKYIDGTTGAGGHAEAILQASSPEGRLLGLDSDPHALEVARARLERFQGRATLVHENFDKLSSVAAANGFVPAQGVLLDLGLSSMQLASLDRGFSFESEGLDMRMDPRTEMTASDLVNGLDETELANLIFRLGEEHGSRRIARAIAAARPITNARQLAEVIERAMGRHGRTHPATKTFQALRMAVNQELENLQAVLPQLAQVVEPGGHVAVITFHSLEDRMVKRYFRENPDWQNLTKHPYRPTFAEVTSNPRARSAKLRVAQRA